MTRVIEVVDYEPNWTSAFEKEAAMLMSIFGDRLVGLHHIGSTAVPGLQAKPVSIHGQQHTLSIVLPVARTNVRSLQKLIAVQQ